MKKEVAVPRSTASRGMIGRAVLSAIVLAISAYLLLTTAPRLGLDLRGGTQIVLETHDSPTAEADALATDRTLEVLRRRVDALGVAEPMLARSGDNRIIIELPGLQDPKEAVEVIGRTAQLTFHPVLADQPADSSQVLPDESGRPLRLGPPRSAAMASRRRRAAPTRRRGRAGSSASSSAAPPPRPGCG
ncbi:hypothetical protein [Actinokineospora xionganensis]|uniref:hypothetical protein n=1 Tax=Actinokineospora xionganensis TaxID=2684470 RepID=UPI001FECDADA|nr:hypothetical protein [Actinokineospora xionganensis]